MAAFLVPLRAHELGAPLDQIGIIVGAGAIVPALLSVWSGELADRFGARRTYIGGTLGSAIMGLAMFPVTNYWWILPIQLVMGFARSTAWIASQTYVANIGTPAERATHMGRLSFTTNGGTVIAPLVIGQVANLVGYQWSFVFMGCVTLLYTVIGLILPEVRVARTTHVAVGGVDPGGVSAGAADRHRRGGEPAAADGQRGLRGAARSARRGARHADEHEPGGEHTGAHFGGRHRGAIRHPRRAADERGVLGVAARRGDGPVRAAGTALEL
jgi:MFS family permease